MGGEEVLKVMSRVERWGEMKLCDETAQRIMVSSAMILIVLVQARSMTP